MRQPIEEEAQAATFSEPLVPALIDIESGKISSLAIFARPNTTVFPGSTRIVACSALVSMSQCRSLVKAAPGSSGSRATISVSPNIEMCKDAVKPMCIKHKRPHIMKRKRSRLQGIKKNTGAASSKTIVA
jgi:hypothetical protein